MDKAPRREPRLGLRSLEARNFIHSFVTRIASVTVNVHDVTSEALGFLEHVYRFTYTGNPWLVPTPPACEPVDTALGVCVNSNCAVDQYVPNGFVDSPQFGIVVGGTGKGTTYEFVAYESSPSSWTRVALTGTICVNLYHSVIVPQDLRFVQCSSESASKAKARFLALHAEAIGLSVLPVSTGR